MRHKSYTTTQVYINMARQMDEGVEALHVPEVLRAKAAGAEGIASKFVHGPSTEQVVPIPGS
jgi:hypothetical protein